MAARKFTAARRKRFLNVLSETANVTLAARASGMSRSSAYRLRKAEASFAEAWDDAVEEALDLIEEEVRRRAVDGREKPVFYQGRECGRVREYSDTLAVFFLKAHRPEKYADRKKCEHTGEDGGPVTFRWADEEDE